MASAGSLGTVLRDARAAQDVSLHAVSARAGCSAGYLHKLESDRVRTPSPRVLARLGAALELPYSTLMEAAGYEGDAVAGGSGTATGPVTPSAPPRYSNAHIVGLLEELLSEVRSLRATLSTGS